MIAGCDCDLGVLLCCCLLVFCLGVIWLLLCGVDYGLFVGLVVMFAWWFWVDSFLVGYCGFTACVWGGYGGCMVVSAVLGDCAAVVLAC